MAARKTVKFDFCRLRTYGTKIESCTERQERPSSTALTLLILALWEPGKCWTSTSARSSRQWPEVSDFETEYSLKPSLKLNTPSSAESPGGKGEWRRRLPTLALVRSHLRWCGLVWLVWPARPGVAARKTVKFDFCRLRTYGTKIESCTERQERPSSTALTLLISALWEPAKCWTSTSARSRSRLMSSPSLKLNTCRFCQHYISILVFF